ncbi:MAG TPA: acetyl-CoA carboxylase biotin carboxyl carrier protein subunit, partial [Vicinamibacteria bacterium]|nr:acetyl-CoA carboxylase biotin carboxyl carrier protein subunit [Vicinamibacteria bacterium]
GSEAVAPAPVASAQVSPAAAAPAGGRTAVYSPFEGKVQLVEVRVRVGDSVLEGQVVAAVEAMKAKHDVRCPCSGRVASIDAEVGSDVVAGRPILTVAA